MFFECCFVWLLGLCCFVVLNVYFPVRKFRKERNFHSKLFRHRKICFHVKVEKWTFWKYLKIWKLWKKFFFNSSISKNSNSFSNPQIEKNLQNLQNWNIQKKIFFLTSEFFKLKKNLFQYFQKIKKKHFFTNFQKISVSNPHFQKTHFLNSIGFKQPLVCKNIKEPQESMKCKIFLKKLKNSESCPFAGRDLRKDSDQHYVTTPLIHVKFWRVVVDEFQLMPSTPSGKLLQMLRKISADNWWCVSGTPLVREVKDIRTPFNILNIYPFSCPEYWDSYALPQYLTMRDNSLIIMTLAKIMSRKTKEQVEDQMKLPELEEVEVVVQFSAIEERQYKEAKECIKKKIGAFFL